MVSSYPPFLCFYTNLTTLQTCRNGAFCSNQIFFSCLLLLHAAINGDSRFAATQNPMVLWYQKYSLEMLQRKPKLCA